MVRRGVIVVIVALALAGATGAAVRGRILYLHSTDRIQIDDLDLFCIDEDAPPHVPRMLACGNTSTGNGPYVRIYADHIDVVSSKQRLLFRVKRDR